MIAFPNLGIEISINPIAIPLPFLGGGVHWYGIIIAAGVLLALWYAVWWEKKNENSTNYIYDLLVYALPAAIVGARLYYVAFDFDAFRGNLADVFKIWEGGLAIYGGIIAAVLVIFIYCKVKKMQVLHVLDVLSMGLLIGQSIGRWGNFVNQEVFGGPCNLPWAMQVESRSYLVHPLFLYESLWNAAGFLLLHFLNKKKPFCGFTFSFYLVWYGIGRFFIEGMRDTAYILYIIPDVLMASQVVAILSILAGVAVGVIQYTRNRNEKVNS